MDWLLSGATAVALLVSVSPAQGGCPRERTRTVAPQLDYGPKQGCAGIDYRLGDLQLSSQQAACPTFVIYTPQHEQPEPSANETKLQLLRFDDVTMVSFRCDRSYLLFIPLGTTCVVDQVVRIGAVPRLLTVPC